MPPTTLALARARTRRRTKIRIKEMPTLLREKPKRNRTVRAEIIRKVITRRVRLTTRRRVITVRLRPRI